MPTDRQKKVALKNKMYENVGNWISRLPTKPQPVNNNNNKPVKYIY